jgi:hypothetical protein
MSLSMSLVNELQGVLVKCYCAMNLNTGLFELFLMIRLKFGVEVSYGTFIEVKDYLHCIISMVIMTSDQ